MLLECIVNASHSFSLSLSLSLSHFLTHFHCIEHCADCCIFISVVSFPLSLSLSNSRQTFSSHHPLEIYVHGKRSTIKKIQHMHVLCVFISRCVLGMCY